MTSSKPGFACSRCENPNRSGIQHSLGSCDTCDDGAALCERCCDRHVHDTKFSGHAFTSKPESAADDTKVPFKFNGGLLGRLGLTPTPSACEHHRGAPFLPLTCSDCVAGTLFCAECIVAHSTSYPKHALKPPAHDIPALRSRLAEVACARISGCYAEAATADSASRDISRPLVACARHKAQAVEAALDELRTNVEFVTSQLESTREAVIAEVQSTFASFSSDVRAIFETKRSSLEAELVKADEAFEGAVFIGASLAEVRIQSSVDSGSIV